MALDWLVSWFTSTAQDPAWFTRVAGLASILGVVFSAFAWQRSAGAKKAAVAAWTAAQAMSTVDALRELQTWSALLTQAAQDAGKGVFTSVGEVLRPRVFELLRTREGQIREQSPVLDTALRTLSNCLETTPSGRMRNEELWVVQMREAAHGLDDAITGTVAAQRKKAEKEIGRGKKRW